MNEPVLLAVRSDGKEPFRRFMGERPHAFADSLSEALVRIHEIEFRIAVIDEDFDGVGTGWLLAESIRKHLISKVKIIVLGSERSNKYFTDETFKGKFDWVLTFPVSKDQFLYELDRKWPVD